MKLSDNIISLHNILADFSYTHDGYIDFFVSDPKPRHIHKASVKDRIVHHLLYHTLYDYFDNRFIFDSYSCRKYKGTHKALDRYTVFGRKVSRNNNKTCYVLKCDVRKFFASIDHKILINILERHIRNQPETMWLLKKVIDSFETANNNEKGLPLGNLTSQLLVNIYMHEFDMYVKQGLRVKYYIRYADDFVIFSPDKTYLEDILLSIEKFLFEQLKLKLHPDKVYIKTYFSGVDFLGWIHFPYYRQLRTTTKRKMIRNLQGYPKTQTVISYRGLLSHGNTYKLQKNFEIFNI